MPSVQAEINELQIYSLQQFTTSPFIEIKNKRFFFNRCTN